MPCTMSPRQVVLPADTTAPRVAREFLAHTCCGSHEGEVLEEAQLLVSELVTNAIRYGGDAIHVRVLRNRSLICEVFDSSSTSPHLRYATMTDEGGRGLFLVAQLAERWGTRYLPAGKVIWAEQPLP